MRGIVNPTEINPAPVITSPVPSSIPAVPDPTLSTIGSPRHLAGQIGTTSTQVLARRLHGVRVQWVFCNLGDTTVFLAFGMDARLNTGLAVPAGGSVAFADVDSIWNGEVNGIAVAACNFCGMEFTK